MPFTMVRVLPVLFAFCAFFEPIAGSQPSVGECPEPCDCSQTWEQIWSGKTYVIVNCRSRDVKKMTPIVTPNPVILDLSNNNIDALSRDFFDGNHNVSQMNLFGNKLSTVEAGVFNAVPRLESLTVGSDIQLTREILSGINDLNHLQCQTCTEMTKLGKGIFANIPKLDFLMCAYSSVSKIENGVFDDVPLLRYIELSYNQLKEVPDFSTLSNLQEIHLQGNRISVFHGNRLANLSIQNLDLRDNQLTSLSTDTVGVLDSYNPNSGLQLYLHGNPWRCDCDVIPIIDKWPTMPWILQDTIICKSPKKFEGMNLWDIPADELCQRQEPPTEEEEEDNPDDDTPTNEKFRKVIIGAAAGSVAGTLLFTIPIVCLVLWCRKKRRSD